MSAVPALVVLVPLEGTGQATLAASNSAEEARLVDDLRRRDVAKLAVELIAQALDEGERRVATYRPGDFVALRTAA